MSENRESLGWRRVIIIAMPNHTFFLEHLPTETGPLLLVTDGRSRVRALDWQDHEARMQRLLRRHYGSAGVELQQRTSGSRARVALERYFAGQVSALDDLAVATGGTEFQRDVWRALRTIPAGTTLSYGALAKKVGRPAAVRAVGLANGANPIGIIVPCHRVIGADRSLTGYGGGIARKRWLLLHEGVAL